VKNEGPTGVMDFRGSVLLTTKLVPGIKLMSSIHPAFILRGQQRWKPIMRLDFKRAAQHSKTPLVWRPKKKLVCIDREVVRIGYTGLTPGDDIAWEEDSDVEGHLDRMEHDLLTNGEYITFDIEYLGSKLVCVGMCNDKDTAYSVRTHRVDRVDRVKRILQSGKKLNAQNSMYDVGTLEWWYGFELMQHLHFDTMVAAYSLNIEYPKDLGFLVSIYTEQPYHKDMVDWGELNAQSKKRPEKFEEKVPVILHYNSIDTWTQHDIMEQQVVELADEPDKLRSFNFDMAKLAPLWEVSKRGVRIDEQHLSNLDDAHELRAAVLTNKLETLTGLENFNAKSNDQVGNLLYNILGLPAGKMTSGGKRGKPKPKVDDITVADAATKTNDKFDLACIKLVREIRESRDLLSKFIRVERDDDGRLRYSFDPTKTGTRRLSSKKFIPTGKGINGQNTPRDKQIRDCYIADPGMELGYADLMAAEFLIVAEETQDKEMLRLADMTIKGTGKVHTHTASFLLEKPLDQITKDDYFIGKKTRHSSNYMLGYKTLMLYVNAEAAKTGVVINAAQAKRLQDRYRMMHPDLPAWWREIESILRKTRTLSNWFGFSRTFYDNIDSCLTTAVAFIPQSTVGDLLNIGLLRSVYGTRTHPRLTPRLRQLLDWIGPDEENADALYDAGFQILAQVHDAILYQYPIENRLEVNSRVRRALEVPMRVPKTGGSLTIPVEVAVGSKWGSVELWEADIKKEVG
jgi:DNA polymerase I-like protein with 3'-5' exonuclease and polymerase domains